MRSSTQRQVCLASLAQADKTRAEGKQSVREARVRGGLDAFAPKGVYLSILSVSPTYTQLEPLLSACPEGLGSAPFHYLRRVNSIANFGPQGNVMYSKGLH